MRLIFFLIISVALLGKKWQTDNKIHFILHGSWVRSNGPWSLFIQNLLHFLCGFSISMLDDMQQFTSCKVLCLLYFDESKLLIYSSFPCSAPNPDNVLIVHTPNGVFSTKILLQNNDKQAFGRLINKEVSNGAILPAEHPEASSAMRCLIYRKAEPKVYTYSVLPIDSENLFRLHNIHLICLFLLGFVYRYPLNMQNPSKLSTWTCPPENCVLCI